MTLSTRRDIKQVILERKPILEALAAAARQARLEHKREGIPLVVWRDGKVAYIPPEEIVVDP